MTKEIIITRDIENVERVEKVVSLNPDKYEWKDFYKMLNDYSWYCVKCGENKIIGFKTFREWLDTEI